MPTSSETRNARATEPIAVPPLNLKSNFAELRAALLAEITEVADSGYYILGPKVAAFEQALAVYCGTRHAIGLSSGTDALLVALMLHNIGPGDEVIVPTFTFFATAGCVSRLGARPVFCDIEPDSFNLDVSQVERYVTPRTKAIIPVHLYGRLADMAALLDLAKRRGLAVIEDAAQAIGARDAAGRPAGSFASCGCLSFYPTKNLGALGDAGALVTIDDQLAEAARLLRVHGSGHTYHHVRVGGNFRIDALQAAILHVKLRHLDDWTRRRRERAATYDRLFRDAGLAPGPVRTPEAGTGSHVYHQYVIRVPRRDELVAHLKARSIGAGVYYPLPLHLQECFADLGYTTGDFPAAEAAAREVVALPIYPELTAEQQRAVVEAIRDFF